MSSWSSSKGTEPSSECWQLKCVSAPHSLSRKLLQILVHGESSARGEGCEETLGMVGGSRELFCPHPGGASLVQALNLKLHSSLAARTPRVSPADFRQQQGSYLCFSPSSLVSMNPWVMCSTCCHVGVSFERCTEGVRGFLTLGMCWGDPPTVLLPAPTAPWWEPQGPWHHTKG